MCEGGMTGKAVNYALCADDWKKKKKKGIYTLAV